MASLISSTVLRTQTDERLVALSRTGHQRAFEAIAERYRAELTRSVRRFLPSASVEDVLQQTHLEAWKALTGGTEVRELRAWLHRIARNAAIAVASRGYDYDELRDALQVAPGPEEELERRDAVRRALRGIAELPERQRDALLAVAVGGHSHAEVAFDLGITDTAARQLVRRARLSLLTLATVMTPPQLVLWAARASHPILAGGGHTIAAGKAGAGLGGSLAAPALKVGAVAIAVGGLAAGVAPIRHAFTPSPPPAPRHHHHRTRPARSPVRLAAALKSPPTAGVTSTPSRPRRPGIHRRRTGHHVPLIASSPVRATTPTATALPTPPPPATTAPATTVAAAPQPQGLAAVVAWAIAHSSQVPGATSTATSSGPSAGQSTPGSPGLASAGGQTGAGTSQCAPASTTPPGSPTTPGQAQAPAGTTGGRSTGCTSTQAFPWSYVSQFFAPPTP